MSAENSPIVMGQAPDPRAFEMHVVVDCQMQDFEAFKARARLVGQKALAIQIDSVRSADRVEIMTAGRGIGSADEAVQQVGQLAEALGGQDSATPALRTRIELAPWHPETPVEVADLDGAEGYFEGHVHLSVPRLYVGDTLLDQQQALAENGYLVELSRNVFKTSNQHGEVPYMVTLRQRGVVLEQFQEAIAAVSDGFDRFLDSEAPVVEYVVYDQLITPESVPTNGRQ